jgi:hypothetical protein
MKIVSDHDVFLFVHLGRVIVVLSLDLLDDAVS